MANFVANGNTVLEHIVEYNLIMFYRQRVCGGDLLSNEKRVCTVCKTILHTHTIIFNYVKKNKKKTIIIFLAFRTTRFSIFLSDQYYTHTRQRDKTIIRNTNENNNIIIRRASSPR